MEVFDRATRLAESLFESANASIILIQEGVAWRSQFADSLPKEDPMAQAVLASDEVLWIADGPLDPRVRDHPLVTGPPFLRFNASVPIRLRNGERPGVLSISGPIPHAYDVDKVARLTDLTDFVADEWARAQAARAFAESLRERDAAVERTERSEERLNMALGLADLHVWELDYVRRELIKAGAEETFFAEPQTYQSLYRDIYVTIDPRDRPGVEAQWRDHVENGAPYRPEFRIDRDDGLEVWAQGSTKLFTDARGRPQRLVGALQNITDRKQAEQALLRAKAEAEAANVAKSAFLATMSHEIRTPLNGVLGMAQAMAADELSSVQRDRLNVIHQSGGALLTILNDILDISKVEAGKLELEEIDFDLGEIARGSHATFASLADEKGLAFTLDVAPAVGVYRGDPTRVRQILDNLTSNALKFTDAGGIQVTIGDTGGGLEIAVSDTGVGMSPETLQAIFQKFAQADSSTTRRFGGTGLGLAICRELAELMGGTVEAASRPDGGACFTVRLPLTRVEATPRAAASLAAEAPAEVGDMAQLRVLAAEDNEINRLVLQTLLLQVGVEPVMVENGAEAVAAWQDGRWDLILMDVQMPVMDGPTATRTIRRHEAAAGLTHTPIIGLTANAMGHQVAEYRAAGMDAVVTKPIDAGKLFETLQAVLDDDGGDARADIRRPA
jgi:signal transduction histidine kinase/CheY-like chemotaxis protein